MVHGDMARIADEGVGIVDGVDGDEEPRQTFPDCVRCKESIASGHAYELGDDKWHTHCFSCYRCEKPLSCDSDFLVLGTGALICFECSDSCKNCGKKIDDLAIILSTSNEAYCSDCFKCCKCDNKIENLRYAKTKKGLFCLSCHEKLLLKRKLHEQKKLRLKKELPNLPQDSTAAGAPIALIDDKNNDNDEKPSLPVPGRSARRPMSSMILSLDEDTDEQLNRNDELLKTNDTELHRDDRRGDNKNAHLRNSSIDDILNSTLEGGLEEDPTLKKSAFMINNNSVSNNSNLLGKYPLRNPTNTASSSKSNLDLTNGSRSNSSNNSSSNLIRSESISAFKTLPIPTDILDILDNPMKKEKSFIANNPESGGSDNDEFIKTPIAFNRTEPISSSYLSSNNQINDNQTQSRSDTDLNTNNTTSFSSDSEQLIPSIENPGSSDISQTKENIPSSTIKRTLSLKSKSLVSNLKNRKSILLDSKYSDPIDKTNESKKMHTSTAKKSNTSNTLKPPVIHSSSVSAESLELVGAFRTPPLVSTSSFKSSTNSEPPYRLSSAIVPEFDLTSPNKLAHNIAMAEEKLSLLLLQIDELEAKKSELVIDVQLLETTKSELLKKPATSVNNSNKRTDISPPSSTNHPHPPISNTTRTTRPKFWKLFSNGRQISSDIDGPKSIELASSLSVSSINQMNTKNSKFEISKPVLQNLNDFDDVKLLPIVDRHEPVTNYQTISENAEKLFGTSLVNRCQYEGTNIPFLVSTCINYIESDEEYLKLEGIYRKSGSKLKIEELEKEFSNSKGNNLSTLVSLMNDDTHIVSGVLKKYLRTLPNPLLTFQVYESLINLVRDGKLVSNLPLALNDLDLQRNEAYIPTCEMFSKILQHLPTEHYDVLLLLSRHISKVADYSEWNLMNMNNLALVFAPGIIRDYAGEKDIVDLAERNYVVAFIFKHYEHILTTSK